MALFRFGHAQKNAFASLVELTLGQIAISSRGLDFSLPVAPDHIDCFPSIRSTAAHERFFRITRRIFASHNVHPAGPNAALVGGPPLDLSCCGVITRATEPIMRAGPSHVRMFPR